FKFCTWSLTRIVSVLPSGPRSVTSRVLWLIAATVAVTVTVFCCSYVPLPAVKLDAVVGGGGRAAPLFSHPASPAVPHAPTIIPANRFMRLSFSRVVDVSGPDWPRTQGPYPGMGAGATGVRSLVTP